MSKKKHSAHFINALKRERERLTNKLNAATVKAEAAAVAVEEFQTAIMQIDEQIGVDTDTQDEENRE